MSLSRVLYRERQRLRADDLNDEQAYRLALRRRHNIGPHTWGIAYGLGLETGSDGIIVQPGMAVDGYGRELLVLEPLAVSNERLRHIQGDAGGENTAILVSLRYRRIPDSPPRDGRWPCGPNENTRWLEVTRLCLTPVDKGEPIDPRRPRGVAEADLEAGAMVDLSDDPERLWPVYLGKLTFDTAKAKYAIDSSARPYVALIGETVGSASGRVQMSVGTPSGAGARFAVTLADEKGNFTDDRLVIDSAGRVTVNGPTTLQSDLQPDDLRNPTPVPGFTAAQRLDARISDLKVGDFQFTEADLVDPECFARHLLFDPTDPRLVALRKKLPPKIISDIKTMGKQSPPPTPSLVSLALEALNGLVEVKDFTSAGLFDGVALRAETRQVLQQLKATKDALGRPRLTYLANFLLLEDLFPDAIRTAEDRTPGAWGVELRPLGEPPKTARPWQIYRVDVPHEDGAKVRQLRIEIADPGKKGDPKRSLFRIGHHDTSKGFVPCLTVDAAGDVTIPSPGQLLVKGELIEGPLTVDPTDPRLAAKLAQQFGEGITAGLQGSGSLELTITTDEAKKGEPWSYTATIQNTGNTTISPVAVYETIVIDQKAPYGSRLLAFITSISAGPAQNLPKPVGIEKLSSANVEVTLMALGVGEAFGYVFARETAPKPAKPMTQK